ncbi:MAG: hypothetical protein KQJ78_02685 [Deltaproteobacteria bacterium]|nr:hypothetical protein [Deltaproteobacteria bacterium]
MNRKAKVCLHVPPGSAAAGRLKSALASLGPDYTWEVTETLAQLQDCLMRTSPRPSLAVLLVQDGEHLARLAGLASLWEDLRLIMVLPEFGPGTLKLAHRLGPRFITHMQSDFSDVREVVAKMAALSRAELRQPA